MENQNETVTQEKGIESLTVDQAASKMLGLMEQPPEASEEQPQTQEPQTQVEAQAEEQETQTEVQEELEEAPQEEEPKYIVKAEGEEHEVTLDDLKKNYQLEANVRKKMETLAHEKKEIEGIKTDLQTKQQEFDQITKTRIDYDNRLNMLNQFLDGQKEDLSALKDSDPVAYATKMVEQQEREKQQTQIHNERMRLAQEQQLQNQKLRDERLVIERKEMLRRIPDLADQEKAQKITKDMRDVGLAVGYSEQELGALADSRAAELLYMAADTWKAKKSKPEILKKVKNAPKMLKAGVAKPNTSQSEKTRQLRQRVKKTGKLRDAAAFFETLN